MSYLLTKLQAERFTVGWNLKVADWNNNRKDTKVRSGTWQNTGNTYARAMIIRLQLRGSIAKKLDYIELQDAQQHFDNQQSIQA